MDALDIARLLEADPVALQIIEAAAELALPDWWLGAGFVRNRVWDRLCGLPPQPDRDIDLIYYAPDKIDPAWDEELEAHATRLLGNTPWQIRNQARMHVRNGDAPYRDTLAAVARWPETATCVATRRENGRLQVVGCHDLIDLVSFTVRPSPAFAHPQGREVIRARLSARGWQERWPTLRVRLD